MSSIPEAQLDSIAASMMTSAAHVLAALVDREVTAGAASSSVSESSLRVEDDWVATTTDVPALGLSFIARYPKADLAKIVAVMVGAEHDGEMDAMQLSIVAETVAQVSSAMGEQLAQAVGASTEGIASHVVGETGSFPAPPFTTYEAELEIKDEFPVAVHIDFDGLALSKLGTEKSAAPTVGAVPKPPPATATVPAAAAAAPQQQPAAAARRPQAPAQPAQFAPMQPTGVQAAAPGHSNLDLVHDIPLQISAVLGQTELALRDVVAMQAGSVFELDKLSTDPIDLYVNNILIARGEVVVVDDKYAVKISELNPLQHERV
ncbi:MAG: flagellar motor switch protein FliN [Candidatus Eremiobacteraeota bacterium]|nr:flagellar motor switch protein FliN [Candidatus Eremiobacteraeota bacterium]MBV8602648.1 flagellar motor switch protein FliN [Candidatus Eremiobacteraeota bacterium]